MGYNRQSTKVRKGQADLVRGTKVHDHRPRHEPDLEDELEEYYGTSRDEESRPEVEGQ